MWLTVLKYPSLSLSVHVYVVPLPAPCPYPLFILYCANSLTLNYFLFSVKPFQYNFSLTLNYFLREYCLVLNFYLWSQNESVDAYPPVSFGHSEYTPSFLWSQYYHQYYCCKLTTQNKIIHFNVVVHSLLVS